VRSGRAASVGGGVWAAGTLRVVDAYLALLSKRDTRRYAERAVPEAAVRRVLEAGRLAGSSRNRQPWRFVIVADPALRQRLADRVYVPGNVRDASFVIAIVVSGRGPVDFEAGRAARNVMLAAWNDGVASCSSGLPGAAAVGELPGLGEGERVVFVLSFGFPHGGRDPAARTPEEWAARADRRPLEEVAERL
jgi:nitroreductase